MNEALPAEHKVSFSPYDIVAFDCDGVLLDSNGFKSSVFASVLAAHAFPDNEIERFLAYQRANFGTSRYRLFAALLEGRFGQKRDIDNDTLLDDFSRQCRTSYALQRETCGLREALELARQASTSLFVVSGSDQLELNDVLNEKGLARTFDQVFGSPATKIENLNRAREYHIKKTGNPEPSMLFLGDALADLEAAEAVGADFVFVARYSSDRQRVELRARKSGWPVIEDLRATH